MKEWKLARHKGALAAIAAWAALIATPVWAQPTNPGVATPAPGAEEATPPPPPASVAQAADAGQVAARVETALAPRAGGLRADDVARRAEMTSPEVRAKQQAVQAAAEKVDQAALLFIPKVSLLARYVRLSDIGPMSFGSGGYLVGTTSPGPVTVFCPAATPNICTANAAGVELSFPTPLNMYTLQGTIGIPLSDYLLRLTQNHAAASKSKEAAELQERATRWKVQNDARTAYYNWIRAKGSLVVADQGLATARAHLKDVNAAVTVGSASKADLLRVESQVASTEMLVENTRNLALLTEEQLRVMLHDPPESTYEIGEDINAPLPPFPPTNLQDLFGEAMRQRLEIRVLDTTVQSLRETRRVLAAGNYPRLDAFANLYRQNPNTRYFPLQEQWKTTWDAGIQLSWTINDTLTTGSQTAELDAKIMEVEAQRAQLMDGIRLQVTQAYNALRNAQSSRDTTERQLKASEESYRVRRELFRAGRATSAELTDAEMDLMKSRFEALNARIDLRVARANLEYALGRQPQPSRL
jgi:outer membrane protein